VIDEPRTDRATIIGGIDSPGVHEGTCRTNHGGKRNERNSMAINEAIYSTTLRLKSMSMISGTIEKDVVVGDDSMPWDAAIVKAFLEDDDIQSIQIVSTYIGFVKTLEKRYKSKD